jgi:hypothetical protein
LLIWCRPQTQNGKTVLKKKTFSLDSCLKK